MTGNTERYERFSRSALKRLYAESSVVFGLSMIIVGALWGAEPRTEPFAAGATPPLLTFLFGFCFYPSVVAVDDVHEPYFDKLWLVSIILFGFPKLGPAGCLAFWIMFGIYGQEDPFMVAVAPLVAVTTIISFFCLGMMVKGKPPRAWSRLNTLRVFYTFAAMFLVATGIGFGLAWRNDYLTGGCIAVAVLAVIVGGLFVMPLGVEAHSVEAVEVVFGPKWTPRYFKQAFAASLAALVVAVGCGVVLAQLAFGEALYGLYGAGFVFVWVASPSLVVLGYECLRSPSPASTRGDAPTEPHWAHSESHANESATQSNPVELQATDAPASRESQTAGSGSSLVATERTDTKLWPLPDGPDWQHHMRTGMYWSKADALFFERESGMFYDPANAMWYDPDAAQWIEGHALPPGKSPWKDACDDISHPLPDGEWKWDADRRLHWSLKEGLFFDRFVNSFFDPNTKKWHDPRTGRWDPQRPALPQTN